MTPPSPRPDFLGIGAQRAGTTWLHRNLSHHRDVWLFPAPLKEIHFFDELHVDGHEHSHRKRIKKFDKYAARLEAKGRATPEILQTIEWLQQSPRDDDWYRTLFTLAPKRKLLGEITPAYGLAPPEGIAHMLRVNPQLKFILMLRHPVDRAWSQVRYTIDRNSRDQEPGSIDTSPERLRDLAFSEPNRRRTSYREIITRFQAQVPDGHLHVAFYDHVRAEPQALLEDIATFLEVNPKRFDNERLETERRHNDALDIPLPPALARELAEMYRADVHWLVDHVAGTPSDWLDKLDRYADAATN